MRITHWFRILLTAGALVPATHLSAAPEQPAQQALDHSLGQMDPRGKVLWFDAHQLLVEGMGWKDTETTYARLPARAKGKAPGPVYSLSRNTAGICIRFATDSTTISAEWDGSSDGHMPHMAQTGSAGLDMYRLKDNAWEYCGTGRPKDTMTSCVMTGDQPGSRGEYLLYLPLYHRVTSLRIGIAPDAMIAPGRPRPADRRKPIVFYGTSITQGGCASRPGMCHTAMLGRWLQREVINLGFSGSGKMEPAMADFVSEIDAEVYVLECLGNMTLEMIRERVEPFVRTLRERRPGVPIVLVEDPHHPSSDEQNVSLRNTLHKLRAEGFRRLTLIPSGPQLRGEENGTVDGGHPTDLGFLRIATAYRPYLSKVLGDKN